MEYNGGQMRIVDVRTNEDGTVDLIDDAGTVYKDCYLKSWKTKSDYGHEVTIVLSAEITLYPDAIKKALGIEEDMRP